MMVSYLWDQNLITRLYANTYSLSILVEASWTNC